MSKEQNNCGKSCEQDAVRPPQRCGPIMVCVVGMDGTPMMPTNPRKARHLIREGSAEIAGYEPFTIRLLRPAGEVCQPLQYRSEAGEDYVEITVLTEGKMLGWEHYDVEVPPPRPWADTSKGRRYRRRKKTRAVRESKPDREQIRLLKRYAKMLPPIDSILLLTLGPVNVPDVEAFAADKSRPGREEEERKR